MASLLYNCNPTIAGVAAITQNNCKHPGKEVKLAFMQITGTADFTTSATALTDIALQSVWATRLALTTNRRIVITPELENFAIPATEARVIETQSARRMGRLANGAPVSVPFRLDSITAADIAEIRELFALANRFGQPTKLAFMPMYENNMVRAKKADTDYFGIPVYSAQISDPIKSIEDDWDYATGSFMLPYGWSVGTELVDISFSPFDLLQS